MQNIISGIMCTDIYLALLHSLMACSFIFEQVTDDGDNRSGKDIAIEEEAANKIPIVKGYFFRFILRTEVL